MRQIRQKFCDLIIVILCLLCLCSFLVSCRDSSRTEEETVFTGNAVEEEKRDDDQKEETQVPEEAEQVIPEVIYVYVCGQVVNPGVYELHQGDRVTHALLAAGGMTKEASGTYLNQAALLEDGQKIYVPSEEEAAQVFAQGAGGTDDAGDAGQTGGTAGDGKVNLNTAGKAELMTLNGIGESRAEAILAYRQEHGRFESIEDIKKIEGIKEGIFNRIKDQLTV